MWGQKSGLLCAYPVPLSTGHPLNIHFSPMVEISAIGNYWLKDSYVHFSPHTCILPRGRLHGGSQNGGKWRSCFRELKTNCRWQTCHYEFNTSFGNAISGVSFPQLESYKSKLLSPRSKSCTSPGFNQRACPLCLGPFFKKNNYEEDTLSICRGLLSLQHPPASINFWSSVYNLQGRPKASKSLFKDSSLASSLQRESQRFPLLFIFILHHSSTLAQAFFLEGLLQSCCWQALSAVVEGVWCWEQAEAAALSRGLRLWTEKTQTICWPSAREFEVGCGGRVNEQGGNVFPIWFSSWQPKNVKPSMRKWIRRQECLWLCHNSPINLRDAAKWD